jgi:bifunctional DNase/RNase
MAVDGLERASPGGVSFNQDPQPHSGGPVIVEVKVQSLGLDRASNTPVVILREEDGERVLPIWIGPGEASAIAMHLADMKFSRPLTHDLLVSVLKGLGGRLDRVIISRVADATYFAEMVVRVGENEISVDARPSDSIAVALRTKARIFANEALLERATIEMSDGDEVLDAEPGPAVAGSGPSGTSGSPPGFGSPGSGTDQGSTPRAMDADELKEYLRRMNPEDFGRFSP